MHSLLTLENIKKAIHTIRVFFIKTHVLHEKFFKKEWYAPAIAIDVLCLLLIMFYAQQPIERLISPIASSLSALRPFITQQQPKEVFGFAPGWTLRKLDLVDLKGLTTLAFFDIPVLSDGTLNRDNTGYEMFASDRAQELFNAAHDNGTDVLVTLTQDDPRSIKQLLNDSIAQDTLITEAIDEVTNARINGVLVDFELTGPVADKYRQKYVAFINQFTNRMHQALPGSKVAVAVPSEATIEPFYDVVSLADKSDRIFMMAYNMAVPETRQNAELATPVFGYEATDYMSKINTYIGRFLEQIPSHKLVTERAFYGNGDNYPLTVLSTKPVNVDVKNTMKTPLSKATIERLVRGVPSDARDAARKNLPLIAKALEAENILTPNVLAYALATIEHETAGTFEPVSEIKGRKSARRLGYEGGQAFLGRGFIQITHLRNYKQIGQRIGLGDALVENPELASHPETAAKILAAFFRDNNIATLATNGNFIAARRPVNPDYQGSWIASLAYKYLSSLV